MSRLPLGWADSKVGDICDYISRGKSPKYTERSELPVVNQKAIRWFGIQDEHLKYIHPDQFDQWAEERFIREGDILWNSTGTGTIGRACFVSQHHLNPPKVVDSHVTIVRPNIMAVDPRYLFAWIRGPQIQNRIEELATGTTNQIELNRTTIIGTEIPLAPLNEQKRIADKLDSVLARVDACREHLDRVPAILKRFRQSVLAAATTGKLTEEWREERGISFSWRSATLGEVGFVTGGLTKNPKRTTLSMRKPYLRVANVYANRLELEDVAEIGLTEAEFEKTKLMQGDLLIVEGNGSLDQIGRAALWDGQISECSHQNHLIRWRPVDQLLSKLALYWLLSPLGRESLVNVAKSTAGLHTLSISKISAIPVMLPLQSEQLEIVRRVEDLFAYADSLEDRYTAARNQVERLTPALLAKAFRGELVPQDPNDEPASVLLERIRVARAAAPITPKRSKGSNHSRKSQKAEVSMLNRKEIQDTHLTKILKEHGPLTAEALWSASQLEIDDYYDQLKDEESQGLLKEKRGKSPNAPRLLEAVA